MEKFKPYAEIVYDYKNIKIPYNILLTANEWREKRESIIKRETNICQVCHNRCMDEYILKIVNNFVLNVPAIYDEIIIEKDYIDQFSGEIQFSYEETIIKLVEQSEPRIPHVHHKHYVLNHLPWEYFDDDLMLVCHICHSKIHETEIINVYSDHSKKQILKFEICSKCNGAGHLREYHYHQNGVCFSCNGVRYNLIN